MMMTKQRPFVRFGMALVVFSSLFAVGGAGAFAPLRTAAAPPVDCGAVATALDDFFTISFTQMLGFTPGINYDAYTDPSSPVYLDFAKLRADLDTLATLPDAADTSFGKVSDAIPRYRRLVDLAESNVKSGGNPFDDGSADGQRYFGIDSPLLSKDFVAVTLANDEACHKQ